MKKFLCKAILNKKDSSDLGFDWAVSKRCIFKFSEDYLEVPGLKLQFAEIESATLRVIPSAFFVPGCVLSVKVTDGAMHHFGLRYSSFWKKELPFSVERSKSKPPLLWPRRILIVCLFAWIIWDIIVN